MKGSTLAGSERDYPARSDKGTLLPPGTPRGGLYWPGFEAALMLLLPRRRVARLLPGGAFSLGILRVLPARSHEGTFAARSVDFCENFA